MRRHLIHLALGLGLALALAGPRPAAAGDKPAMVQMPAALCCGNCDCYFTYVEKDCPPKQRCNRQVTCNLRKPKPGGTPGAGCTEAHDVKNQCDGVCEEVKTGSFCGVESVALVQQFIDLWGRAFTEPAIAGGGGTDARLTTRARELPFDNPYCAEDLANLLTDAIGFCRGDHFLIHPETEHGMEGHLVADISGNSCLIDSGNLCFEALAEGLVGPERVDPVMARIADSCFGGLPFATPCAGDDALHCATETIREIAVLLRTPRLGWVKEKQAK